MSRWRVVTTWCDALEGALAGMGGLFWQWRGRGAFVRGVAAGPRGYDGVRRVELGAL